MADSRGERLAAIRGATQAARWRLLKYAATVGPFAATDAARIAGLTSRSGNARSNHAERLCALGLLSREPGSQVRYRATSRGMTMYKELSAILVRPRISRVVAEVLPKGGRLEVIAEVNDEDRGTRYPVTLRITRQT